MGESKRFKSSAHDFGEPGTGNKEATYGLTNRWSTSVFADEPPTDGNSKDFDTIS